MVVFPLVIGFYLLLTSVLVHKDNWGGRLFELPTNRIIYALCSVIGIMLVHQGLDAISKYFNHKLGDDRFTLKTRVFGRWRRKLIMIILLIFQ